ncbi:hypothetical protein PAXRUDRAFT_22596 [Paxillus rubicundulus Ve08.2h10]|uniref:Uncharacterized protein n=1 Tax=Paxillus rubicundulus Ve08.2h10 TaxID=930991 RepID=A0A0D0CXA3_9AGAM|nr:hypothetical protein PAXRUDRAFT_22596 [Paxillus rubicundulus Ve08.2h10]
MPYLLSYMKVKHSSELSQPNAQSQMVHLQEADNDQERDTIRNANLSDEFRAAIGLQNTRVREEDGEGSTRLLQCHHIKINQPEEPDLNPPHDEQAPPHDEQPPPHDEQPPPHDEQPPPHDKQAPPQNEQAPPQNEQPPPHDEQAPPQNKQAPPVNQQDPPNPPIRPPSPRPGVPLAQHDCGLLDLDLQELAQITQLDFLRRDLSFIQSDSPLKHSNDSATHPNSPLK